MENSKEYLEGYEDGFIRGLQAKDEQDTMDEEFKRLIVRDELPEENSIRN